MHCWHDKSGFIKQCIGAQQQQHPNQRTLNLADKEARIVAENVGSKVADITLEKVGKWPTQYFYVFLRAGKLPTLFFG